MSTASPMPTYPLHAPNHFLHTCGFCGCVFRVEVTWCASYSRKLHQNVLPYACPECQRHSRIKTSSEPQVVLVSKRTDGRTSPCPAIE